MKRDRRTGQQVCRFNFPRPTLQRSTVELQDQKLVYTPARNHDRSILQIWRANIDVQPITSKYAVVNYIAKYASKGESRSHDLNDFMQRSMFAVQSSATAKQAVQKFCVKCVANEITRPK